MVGSVESGVQTLYYGLGIIFMLGGVVAAYVRALQGRISKQEAALVDVTRAGLTSHNFQVRAP